jgi:hypothetical protein
MEFSNDDGERQKQTIIIREYKKIEDALHKIIKLQGRAGVLTDYVILSAVQSLDEDGTFLTNTGWHTNPENGVPYHRMMGLVEYNRELLKKEAVEADDVS